FFKRLLLNISLSGMTSEAADLIGQKGDKSLLTCCARPVSPMKLTLPSFWGSVVPLHSLRAKG
ncbi:MAG TPA: hypothetical protein VHP34_00095, partial [Alphaproteobacteria bacterium]|nr:hypothetical protein [Alphaproteobacteria bacterium]